MQVISSNNLKFWWKWNSDYQVFDVTMDKKKLAQSIRNNAEPRDKPMNINITVDLSSLANVMRSMTPEKKDEYQKVDGLHQNVS